MKTSAAPRWRVWNPLLGIIFVLALAGCQREKTPAPGGAEQRYPVKGTVVRVEFTDNRVVLDHEAIPGYMDAMTMPFAVRERSLLNGLDAGDVVSATLVVDTHDNRSWLEDLKVVRKGQSNDSPSQSPGRDAKPGEPVPDAALVDQDGRPLHIADYKGKALALTFIYVRCPLPEFCPRMTSHFAAIEKALAQDDDLYQKTRLLSISFDPEHDTPAVLKAYAKPFQLPDRPPFGHWALASGPAQEVRRVAEFFGLEYLPDKGSFTHNLRTVVVRPDGTVFRVYKGSEWEPADVVADLRAVLAP